MVDVLNKHIQSVKCLHGTACKFFSRIMPLLLLLVFAFPRLHQDIHRFVGHGISQTTCPVGEENESSHNSSCIECAFSFFITVVPSEGPVLADFPISARIMNDLTFSALFAETCSLHHLRGPPEEFLTIVVLS